MRNTLIASGLYVFAGIIISCFVACCQTNDKLRETADATLREVSDQKYTFDQVIKKLEDALWFDMLGEDAYIDKVRIAGPPRHRKDSTGNEFKDRFLDNDRIFFSYVFIPRETKRDRKYPLIVFSHGGIHGTFTTLSSHIVREWVKQGYIVVAPDYRGSTGYGKKAHLEIDYGGLENEDVLASRNYMADNYSIVDPDKVAVVGWSHGGMTTLMNILRYPDAYACAYAGVPVSDVTYRLTYKGEKYIEEFSAPYHIGKRPEEAPEEYARRSPVTYAPQLRKPLMITTTENDDDVSVEEVKRMIDALKANGKEFEYKIYGRTPGGHVFDRLDSKEATEARYLMHKFLEKHLAPPKPFKSYGDMREAGYYFK